MIASKRRIIYTKKNYFNIHKNSFEISHFFTAMLHVIYDIYRVTHWIRTQEQGYCELELGLMMALKAAK